MYRQTWKLNKEGKFTIRHGLNYCDADHCEEVKEVVETLLGERVWIKFLWFSMGVWDASQEYNIYGSLFPEL